ncbi:TPA: hypothetical protein QB310_002101 [Pasteurella multocida]|nr:hypothetical protein [Pasteurella multocida]
MKKIKETRSHSIVNCYVVDITSKMKQRSLEFATAIVNSNNQYSRLVPDFALNDFNLRQKIEIQRTYVGKLGELAFLEYLNFNNVYPNTDDMFEVYQGQTNTDNFDFNINGYSIDIKTGFRTIHSRLLINMEQFIGIPKDFYVAVYLNAIDSDSNNKIIDLNSITEATIKGYADWNYLNKTANNIRNFGEGDAKHHPYNELFGIDKLLNQLQLER